MLLHDMHATLRLAQRACTYLALHAMHSITCYCMHSMQPTHQDYTYGPIPAVCTLRCMLRMFTSHSFLKWVQAIDAAFYAIAAYGPKAL